MTILGQYRELNISKDTLLTLNKKLALPAIKLTPFARKRRQQALYESLSWPKGPDQDHRIYKELYFIENHSLGVSKPGKEASPEYKGCRNYKTHEKTNNPNDMLPLIVPRDKSPRVARGR